MPTIPILYQVSSTGDTENAGTFMYVCIEPGDENRRWRVLQHRGMAHGFLVRRGFRSLLCTVKSKSYASIESFFCVISYIICAACVIREKRQTKQKLNGDHSLPESIFLCSDMV